MTSHYDFDANSLKDSKSFTESIIRNIVPKGGKNIVSTSLSERGFEDKTLTSVDLFSAASGKELFKNPVYENAFRANLIRENLNSLSASILEGQFPDSIKDPASLSAQILTQSGLAVEGNRGLLTGLNANLNSTYNNYQTQNTAMAGGLPHLAVDYESSARISSEAWVAQLLFRWLLLRI